MGEADRRLSGVQNQGNLGATLHTSIDEAVRAAEAYHQVSRTRLRPGRALKSGLNGVEAESGRALAQQVGVIVRHPKSTAQQGDLEQRRSDLRQELHREAARLEKTDRRPSAVHQTKDDFRANLRGSLDQAVRVAEAGRESVNSVSPS